LRLLVKWSYRLKSVEFLRYVHFLVSTKLCQLPILGAYFTSNNTSVLDLVQSRHFFNFASSVLVKFTWSNPSVTDTSYFTTTAATVLHWPTVNRTMQASVSVTKYPVVLMEELGLTHMLEYVI
jgi:hypothetical protein